MHDTEPEGCDELKLMSAYFSIQTSTYVSIVMLHTSEFDLFLCLLVLNGVRLRDNTCTCVCASKHTQHKTDTHAIRGARMRIVTDGVYIVSTEMCFHMYYFNDSYGRRTGMCG